MNITVKYQINEDNIGQIIMNYNEETLMKSPYMAAIFEATNVGDNMDIDLTFVKYLKEDHIKLLFQLEFEDYSQLDHIIYTPKKQPELIILVNGEETSCECTLDCSFQLSGVDYPDLKNISVLVDYLQFDRAEKVFKKCLSNYVDLFDFEIFIASIRTIRTEIMSNDILPCLADDFHQYGCPEKLCNPDDIFFSKLILHVEKICTVRLKYIIKHSEYANIILSLYYKAFINAFIDNIDIVHSAFLSFRIVSGFYQIFTHINSNTQHIEFPRIIDIPLKQYEFVESDLERYDLKHIYNLLRMNTIFPPKLLDPTIDIYKYYHLLDYQDPSELFSFWNVINFDRTAPHKTIIPLHIATKRFRDETQGYFDNFNWKDAQISGSFIYNLLNDMPIKDTILDIYCFSFRTFGNVIDYFDSITTHIIPYFYTMDAKYVLILTSCFSFHIRIVFTLGDCFTFGYEPVLFDGKTFRATIDGIVMLKYKITDKYNKWNVNSVIKSGVLLDVGTVGNRSLPVFDNAIDFSELDPFTYAKLSRKIVQLFDTKDYLGIYTYLQQKYPLLDRIYTDSSKDMQYVTALSDNSFILEKVIYVKNINLVLDECKIL